MLNIDNSPELNASHVSLSPTFLGLLFIFHGFKVDGRDGTDELHWLCLDEERALIPARSLQIEPLDINSVLQAKQYHVLSSRTRWLHSVS